MNRPFSHREKALLIPALLGLALWGGKRWLSSAKVPSLNFETELRHYQAEQELLSRRQELLDPMKRSNVQNPRPLPERLKTFEQLAKGLGVSIRDMKLFNSSSGQTLLLSAEGPFSSIAPFLEALNSQGARVLRADLRRANPASPDLLRLQVTLGI